VESRQKYRDIYDFAPIGFITLNKQGVIQEANFYSSVFLNLSRSELQQKRLQFFVDAAYQDECFLHYRKVFDTGGRQTCELKLKDRYVHINSQAHIPDDGHCFSTLVDITHLANGIPKK